MKIIDYFAVCSLLNKGVKKEQIEVEIQHKWVSWDDAQKVLKGADAAHCKYRVKQ